MTKYIGPKTDGENVATQADKLSLSSETPDVLTPDQTGAAGTATTAARSDHQHEILAGAAGTIEPDDTAAEGSSTSFARADHRHAIAAASAGTITGTNAEGTSTSFARADHDHAYGSLSIPNSALALGPTYETSLPGSPVDGQEIYYAANATASVIWHLRYRSAARSGSGAWEYLGGPPLREVVDTSENLTSNGWANLATSGPSITVALKGQYRCLVMALFKASGDGDYALVGLKVGSATTENVVQNENGQLASLASTTLATVSSTSTTLKLEYQRFSGTANFRNRRLEVTPVYVYA